MKNLLKFGLCLLLIAGFAACDKEETPVTGRLKIEIAKTPLKSISIYTEAGNEIRSVDNPGENVTIVLNPGNYAITANSSGISYYFQIQAGRTTHITYFNATNPIITYQ